MLFTINTNVKSAANNSVIFSTSPLAAQYAAFSAPMPEVTELPDTASSLTVDGHFLALRVDHQIAKRVADLPETLQDAQVVAAIQRATAANAEMRALIAVHTPWVDALNLTGGQVASISRRMNKIMKNDLGMTEVAAEKAFEALLTKFVTTNIAQIAIDRKPGRTNRFTDDCTDPFIIALKAMLLHLFDPNFKAQEWMTIDQFMKYLDQIAPPSLGCRLKHAFIPLTRNQQNALEVEAYFCSKTGIVHNVVEAYIHLLHA